MGNKEEFEGDPKKAALNIRKHKKKNKEGLSFEEAEQVFDDEFFQEKYDPVHSTVDEDRYQVIGRVRSQLVVFVVYTPRNGKRRIISARLATERERKFYYEQIRRYYSGM
ncbi:MAG: BrnT family toxin [Treponema sp.]|nr:BrnT family toxin [Treponema sp.]MBQ6567138.1 BrnT family toxin [Treponema sp.]MBQ7168174.1 BrnT family toxin [Treponema sp.]